MTGRFTFPAILASSMVALFAALACIILLWVPVPGFHVFYINPTDSHAALFHVRPPRTTPRTRYLMTANACLAILFALVAFLLVLLNTRRARRGVTVEGLDGGDFAMTPKTPQEPLRPAKATIDDTGSLERLAPPDYTARPGGDTGVGSPQQGVVSTQAATRKTWLQAWEAVPYEACTGAWTWSILGVLVIGLVSMILQGIDMDGLADFIAAGACGMRISECSDELGFCSAQDDESRAWAERICDFFPAPSQNSLVPAEGSPAVNMLQYGWTLTTPLAMSVLLWVSMALLFGTLALKVRADKIRRGLPRWAQPEEDEHRSEFLFVPGAGGFGGRYQRECEEGGGGGGLGVNLNMSVG